MKTNADKLILFFERQAALYMTVTVEPTFKLAIHCRAGHPLNYPLFVIFLDGDTWGSLTATTLPVIVAVWAKGVLRSVRVPASDYDRVMISFSSWH